jgi:hypothetical protein
MKSILSLVLVVVLAGCSTTQFSKYEGDSVRQGTGGTKTVVDGVDFWTNGTPPRKYQVLGIIKDQRLNKPLIMISRDGTLASEVKKQGGDALIILGESSQYLGSTVNTRTHGTVTTSQNNSPAWMNNSGNTYSNYQGQTYGNAQANYATTFEGVVVKYLE